MCFLLSLIISAIADFVNDYNHKKYKIISIALFLIYIYLKNKKSCPKARLFCIFCIQRYKNTISCSGLSFRLFYEYVLKIGLYRSGTVEEFLALCSLLRRRVTSLP